ncbi:MAG: hypothetical protein ACMXYD_01855 [Candidatus Woesearchaeota archaeon]
MQENATPTKWVQQKVLQTHNKTLEDSFFHKEVHVCEEAEKYFLHVLNKDSSQYQNGIIIHEKTTPLALIKLLENKTALALNTSKKHNLQQQVI